MQFPLLLSALALSAVLYGQEPGTRVVPGSGVIDTPGRYVLNNDATLRSHGASILITASNVWLNLNGNTVMGPGGKTALVFTSAAPTESKSPTASSSTPPSA